MRRTLLALGLAVALGTAGTATFYIVVAAAAKRELLRSNVPPLAHNALQHSFGAAEIYATARMLGFTSPLAHHSVDSLGRLNEWIEHYVSRSSKRDSTEEVYKDLRNNLIGAATAEWLEKTYGHSSTLVRLRVLAFLAGERELLWLSTDIRVPKFDSNSDPSQAMARHDADRSAIVAGINGFLAKRQDKIDALVRGQQEAN